MSTQATEQTANDYLQSRVTELHKALTFCHAEMAIVERQHLNTRFIEAIDNAREALGMDKADRHVDSPVYPEPNRKYWAFKSIAKLETTDPMAIARIEELQGILAMCREHLAKKDQHIAQLLAVTIRALEYMELTSGKSGQLKDAMREAISKAQCQGEDRV